MSDRGSDIPMGGAALRVLPEEVHATETREVHAVLSAGAEDAATRMAPSGRGGQVKKLAEATQRMQAEWTRR